MRGWPGVAQVVVDGWGPVADELVARCAGARCWCSGAHTPLTAPSSRSRGRGRAGRGRRVAAGGPPGGPAHRGRPAASRTSRWWSGPTGWSSGPSSSPVARRACDVRRTPGRDHRLRDRDRDRDRPGRRARCDRRPGVRGGHRHDPHDPARRASLGGISTEIGLSDITLAPSVERASRLWVRTGENGWVTDIPRSSIARTAKLVGLPLGHAGRAALGVGKGSVDGPPRRWPPSCRPAPPSSCSRSWASSRAER